MAIEVYLVTEREQLDPKHWIDWRAAPAESFTRARNMDIRKVVAYRGPNVWSSVRVLEATIDFGQSHHRSRTDALLDFVARLESWLNSIVEPLEVAKLQGRSELPTDAQAAEFSQELRRGTSLAAALGHVIRVFETAAGTPPGFVASRSLPETCLAEVAFQYEEEAVARACLDSAFRMICAALDGTEFDAMDERRKLVDLADDERLGPSSRAITNAATKRGIPFRRLNAGSLVQLGEGKFQRRIWTAETDATSAIAEQIAQDKDLTKAFLSSVGVPVPLGRIVSSAEDAWAAALEIGFPVAVKPRDANHGRGISLDLTNKPAILEAYDFAQREGDVLVERYAHGSAYRLLVVGDRLIAAARGEQEVVIGDGKLSIVELVEKVNQDPLRGENYTDPLGTLNLREPQLIELRKQGLTPESIPSLGKRVLLRRNGDLTTDCTAEVHPAVAEKAVLAAQTIGLDIAGLDVIAEDISRPFEEQGGVIVEVNAGPGLSHHVAPLFGEPQPVGEAIIDMIFPPGRKSRMPIIAVTGSGQRADVVLRVERFVGQTIVAVSSASERGIFHRSRKITISNPSDAANIHALLLHPNAEAAIFEIHPTQASSEGIGCERCDVVVVMDTDDETTLRGATALVRAVPPSGTAVLPANGSGLAQLIAACRGAVLLCSTEGETASIQEHRANGGRAVFLNENQLVLAIGTSSDVIELQSSRTAFSTLKSVVLPAVAATWAAGFSLDSLRTDSGEAE